MKAIPDLTDTRERSGRFLFSHQMEDRARSENQKGDAEARERMINSNLRLVVTIAYDYANLTLPKSSLM